MDVTYMHLVWNCSRVSALPRRGGCSAPAFRKRRSSKSLGSVTLLAVKVEEPGTLSALVTVTDEELTAGELEWEETYAFFKPEQLRKAGCTEMELRCAGFSSEDLLEADYVENKLPRVVPAKAMPRPPIRKTCAISAKRMPRRVRSATVHDELSAS